MKIQQIIEEQMQEFDERFGEGIDKHSPFTASDLKSFISSYTRKLIEALGEELIEQTLSYEDSGITPEQLATFQRFNLKEIINSLK